MPIACTTMIDLDTLHKKNKFRLSLPEKVDPHYFARQSVGKQQIFWCLLPSHPLTKR